MAGLEGFRLPLAVDIDNRRSLKTTERYDEHHLTESRRKSSAVRSGTRKKKGAWGRESELKIIGKNHSSLPGGTRGIGNLCVVRTQRVPVYCTAEGKKSDKPPDRELHAR